jgi:thiamine monophosphate kinase
LDWALHGGEDYVLIAAIKEASLSRLEDDAKHQGIDLFRIGILKEKPGIKIVRRSGITEDVPARGWNHFTKTLE